MKQKFDIAKEFPNSFQEVTHRIAASQKGARAKSLVQVENLLSANLEAILNRLNLVYVDEKGQPATGHFFQKLVEKMQKCLPEGANQDNLEVYISGGVVRTLLAYIYKELHTTMQSREVNKDERNKKITKAKELQRKSHYLHIRNRLVEHYKQHDAPPLNIERVCDELAGSNQNERHIIKDLYAYLGKNLSEIEVSGLNRATDNGLYHAYLLLENPKYQSAHSCVWLKSVFVFSIQNINNVKNK